MSKPNDYGYAEINWEETTPANVKLVEAEYRERLTNALATWNDLDGKARTLFPVLISLITVLGGWVLSQSQSLGHESQLGLYALAVMLFCAAMCVAGAMLPRNYSYPGMTPNDLTSWKPLLFGNDKDALRLSGARITEYAKAIVAVEKSNDSKARWLKRSVQLILAAFPLAVLFAKAATVTSAALLDLSKTPVGSPIGILIVAATLVLGIVIGRLLSTRLL